MTVATAPAEHSDEITDWSVEGRREYVERRRDAIRWTLWESFSMFNDDPQNPPLSAFGFRGDAPEESAVEFVLERFQSDGFDGSRIWREHRSMKLFTRVPFWLQQKVGEQAYGARLGEWSGRSAETPHFAEAAVETPATVADAARHDTALKRMSDSLRALRERTCAPLVGEWLGASTRLLKAMGLLASPTKAAAFERSSDGVKPTERSLRRADALFRYLVLYLELLDGHNDRDNHVLEAELLAGTPDDPPYRVNASVVAACFGLPHWKAVAQARNRAILVLLDRALSVAESDEQSFEVAVARFSCKASLLHRYKIENGPTERMKALPRLSL